MNNVIPAGLKIIEPKVFYDDRGYFYESYNKKHLSELGIEDDFVQDNQSFSSKGVIRGLHMQSGDSAQSKLVRVVAGAVVDFVLDARADSATYGKMYYVLLTGENKKSFYIPRGFAHGFLSLRDGTIFQYKCDNFYDKKSECGYSVLSPRLYVLDDLRMFLSMNDYDLKNFDPIFSEKDVRLPNFTA